MKKICRTGVWLLAGLACFSARADIQVGQTVGVTGSVAATVKESMDGAQLYIDAVNARGGIKGEKIQLITLDDRFDIKQAVENARILVEDKKVVALFMNRGTPHTEAIMPLLEKFDVPLIAPSTGASILHEPVKRQIFNVRSSYQREAEKSVVHLHTIALTRIAIVHVDDTFGRDALEGAMKGFQAEKFLPVVTIKADRTKPDYAKIVPALIASKAQALIWIGSGNAVSDGIKALREAGSAAQVVTLSNNASGGFIKNLGKSSTGVIVSQVFPHERAFSYAFVAEAAELAKAKGIQELSPAILEGFAGAKVLVEALRRASPHATRAKVITALESMSRFDIGGLEVSYSATDHTGLDFSDLSIIGSDGRFHR